MVRILKKFVIITSMIILVLACGCSNSSTSVNQEIKLDNSKAESQCDIFAMDTYMNLKAYGENSENAIYEAKNEVLRLEKLFSVTDENSDIYKINHSNGKKIKVSNDTINLITKANEVSKSTDRAVDISIYPVIKEWGFTTENYKIPKDEAINELLKNVDYTKIKIDGNYVTIPQDFAIDLGSVAKGYTSDKVTAILKKNGVKSAIINLGGNVHTVGKKTNNKNWTVGIKNPVDIESNICTIEIDDKCVITSGNYERYFLGDDGKNYWHIMDTKTGKPADNGIISATVIGDNGTLCDSLSTALFVMGTEKAIDFVKKHNQVDVILITSDMNIYITKDIENSVKILNPNKYSYVTIE